MNRTERMNRTLALARGFRESASFIANNPPPEGIDPVIWEAQRQAALSMAEDLEGQARVG